MNEFILIESDESEDSVIEVAVPKKPSPPVVDILDDEIILNVQTTCRKTLLAKDVIRTGCAGPTTSQTSENVSQSVPLSSPNHWTSDMIKFYDDDWGDEENFIVEKLQEKMDKSPWLWKISNRDLEKKSKKKSHVRCWNCFEFGHHVNVCRDPPHVPKCRMCGIAGHLNTSCPDSKCLNCGNPSDSFSTSCFKCKKELNQVCSRCELKGHNFINCSDHWRLFHLTTGSRLIKIPYKDINKHEKDLWCCNCGRQGHHYIQCPSSKNSSSYSDTHPFVTSYQKAFKDRTFTSTQNDIPNWRMKNLVKNYKNERFRKKTRRFIKRNKKKKSEPNNKNTFIM